MRFGAHYLRVSKAQSHAGGADFRSRATPMETAWFVHAMRDMRALESLRDEHRVIGRVLDSLEDYGKRLEEDASTNPSSLRRLAAFLVEFVGIWHHGKEEELLMPLLVQHGLAWDESPIEEIRRDHEQEDYLVRVVEQGALQDEAWSAEDRRHAVRSIEALVAFERAHIQREEATLYLAAEELPADVLRSLEENCHKYERACFGRTTYAELRALAEPWVSESTDLTR
jgi:hemerythrin-like domain-containing protein